MCDGQKFSPKHIEAGGEKSYVDLSLRLNLINQMLKLLKFFFWILQ